MLVFSLPSEASRVGWVVWILYCNHGGGGVCFRQEKIENMNGLKFGILLAIASMFPIQTVTDVPLPKGPVGPANPLQDNYMVADILFIGDWSSSMRSFRPTILNAIISCVGGLNLTEDGVKVGIMTFTHVGTLHLAPTTDEVLLYTVLDSLNKKDTVDGLTYLDPALHDATEVFNQSMKERSLFAKFLVE